MKKSYTQLKAQIDCDDELRAMRAKQKYDIAKSKDKEIFWGMIWCFDSGMYLNWLFEPIRRYCFFKRMYEPQFKCLLSLLSTPEGDFLLRFSNREEEWKIIIPLIDQIHNLIHDVSANSDRGYILPCPKCKELKPYNEMVMQNGVFLCPACRGGK